MLTWSPMFCTVKLQSRDETSVASVFMGPSLDLASQPVVHIFGQHIYRSLNYPEE
jgi:hypothetical protein